MNISNFNYVDIISLLVLILCSISFGIKGATKSISYSLKIILSVSIPFIFFKRILNYSKKVRSLMADVGLDASNYHKYPSEVSGGMKKRVALARALYKNPKVIFLDEPTTGLDPINSDLINDLIIKVIKKRKITAVTITHDIKSAIKTGDNFYFIHKGITQEECRCDKILSTKNNIFKSFITVAIY